MAGYIGSKASVVSSGAERKKTFAITTTTTVLSGLSYTPTFVHLFHNGVRLVDGTDYTATDGTSITLTSAAESGDEVVVISYATFQAADVYTKADADAEFVSDPNGAVTVDGSGNVGIGTTAPNELLEIEGGNMRFTNTVSNDSRIYFTHSSTANRRAYMGALETDGNGNSLIFAPNANGFDASEAMRIDSSGNLLVGKTTTSGSVTGLGLYNSGLLEAVADGDIAATLKRLNSDGEILRFRKDSTTVGRIGSRSGGGSIYIDGAANFSGLQFNGDAVVPRYNGATTDNVVDLGVGSIRYDDIYATNGTIQTSDRNEKQDIEVLSDAETRVAQACKGLLRKFRWKDAVAEKGDDARIHFGIIAQDLQDAFAAEGLDAGNYAMFISSTWWETQTDVPAVEAVEAVEATYDEDGNELTPAVEAVEAKEAYIRTDTFETLEEAPEGATERTRLGVRYPELLAFIIAAI